MKRKGFTLIELLAVIVILAIIALIATPIVLSIISDTKESATIRSAENYISAVEQAVAAKQLNGQAFNPDTCTTLDNGNLLCGEETLEVNFSGNKPVSGASIKFNKGSVVAISNFKIGGKNILASSLGLEEAITTKTVYRWSEDSKNIGDTLTSSDYTLDPTTLNKIYYLKHILDKDNKITESYACVKFNGETERCLKGGDGTPYGWVTSKTDSTGRVAKLYEIEQEQIPNVSCTFDDSYSDCHDDSVYLSASSNGRVGANDGNGGCDVYDGDSSSCYSF